MPLETICIDCNKPYMYMVTKKAQQTGRCSTCQHKYDIDQMNQELSSLQRRIQTVIPNLKKLNTAKRLAQTAYEEAYEDWENAARVHAALDRKISIITHERDLLVGAKEIAAQKSSKKTKTPEQKAKAALNKLPASVRAALLKQFNEEQTS